MRSEPFFSRQKVAIIGGKYRNLVENGMNSVGILPIWLPGNPDVDARLCGHADLSVLHLREKVFLAAPFLRNCSDFLEKMEKFNAKIEFIPRQGRGYPQEAGLNICVCGEHVICNPATAEPSALSSFAGKNIISVKQGYSRCAVCKVNNHAIITADHGIAKALEDSAVDVLEITPGYVRLDGFDYGFIGGASFVPAEGFVAFTGHLHAHPDEDRICKFLEKHAVRPIYLSDEPIFDIGGSVLFDL